MQIVEALADADVLDAGGQVAYTLQAGCRYVVYDSEAAHGLRAGAVKLVTTLDRVLPVYRSGPLAGDRPCFRSSGVTAMPWSWHHV